MKINQVAQRLLNRDPQANSARLAFYHFLKNFCRLDKEFTAETLDRFYDFAMLFQQWRSNPADLGTVVAEDLKAIAGMDLTGVFENGLHAHQIQWVDIEQDRDFESLLEAESKLLKERGEKVTLIRLNKSEVLRLRIHESTDRIIAEVKPKLGFIDGPNVRLVRASTQLTYTMDLELSPDDIQVLRISPLKFARFSVSNGDFVASILQGASFSRIEAHNGSLEEAPELFWALKKLEKNFINPVTDSSYLILIEECENALAALKKFHPNREVVASRALKRAELYMENIFPNDKALKTLVSQLQYQLRRDDAKEPERCQRLSPLPPTQSV